MSSCIGHQVWGTCAMNALAYATRAQLGTRFADCALSVAFFFFWFNHAYCNTGFNMGWRYHYVMSQALENAHQLQLQPGIATTETCYPCSQIDLTACMVIDTMEGINCSIKRLTGFL